MSPPEQVGSNGGNAQGASAHEQKREQRRTISEKTSIRLSLLLTVLLPVVSALLAGAYTVGRWMGVNNSDLQRKLAEATDRNRELTNNITELTHGLWVDITSLDMSDRQVEDLIQPAKTVHADSEVSSYLNQRGLNIYRAEKTRAAGRPLRRTEIDRALRWFKEAEELDKTAFFPYWNAACMFGLLHNADEAVRSLMELEKALPPNRRAEFEGKIARDTDLCPIDEDTVFKDYVQNQWKVHREAQCSGGRTH